MLLKLTELSSCRRCFTISITSEHSELVCFNTTSAICERWITSWWRRWNSKHRAHRHSILWLCFVNWKRGKYSTSSTCIVAWRSERDCTHETISFSLFELSSKTSSISKRAQILWRAWSRYLSEKLCIRSWHEASSKRIRKETNALFKKRIDLHFQI